MRRWLPLVTVLSLCTGSMVACSAGAPKAPADATVVVNNQVNVVVNGGPTGGNVPPSIDLNDPRLAVAQNEIETLLGHPLEFEVDRTLIPAFDHALHDAFVAALENTVTQLRYCQKREPYAFSYAVAHFRTLRWTYSAAQDPDDPSFELGTGLVTVQVPPDQHRLLLDYTLVETLLTAVQRERIARYSNMAADKVPAAEYATYFEFQRGYQRPQQGAQGRTPSSEETELRKLGNVLALYPRLPPGELQGKVRHYLANEGSQLRRTLTKTELTNEAKQLLADVHPRWIRWLNLAQGALNRDEQKTIADLMFNRQYAPFDGFRRGFKALEFATPHVRAWLELQAAPKTDRQDDPIQQTVLCPYTQHRSDEYLSAASYCNGALYLDLFRQTSGPKKLAQLLIREKGNALTQTATLHVTSKLGTPQAVTLLEALSADEQASKAALVALARFSEWGPSRSRSNDEPVLDPDPLFKLIPSWWASHPTRRPQLLYLLTQLGQRYEGVIAWPKLAIYLGARISAEELSAFLDQDPRTIWALRNLENAFSEGWRRSDLLLPKLDGWLNAYNKGGGDGPEPYYVTERVVECLCVTGTARDVRALQTYVRERLESFPSENRSLGSFAEKKLSELCPRLPTEERQVGKRPVLFGD